MLLLCLFLCALGTYQTPAYLIHHSGNQRGIRQGTWCGGGNSTEHRDWENPGHSQSAGRRENTTAD